LARAAALKYPLIADCPSWVIDLVGASPHKRSEDLTPLVDLDSHTALTHAKAFLLSCDPAAEGSGGDEHTYKTAAAVKDLGVSEMACLDLMLDHWNERCSPPWMPDDLAAKVAHAYSYGQNAPGLKSPEHDFGDVPTQAESTKRGRLYFELPDEMQTAHESPYLIKGFLDQGASSVVFGDSNVGKSFVMLDVAFHIAAGRPWREMRVHRQGVVYVAAEGGRTIRSRILALKKHFAADSFALALVPCSVDLGVRSADTRGLIDLIGEAAKRMDVAVGLVVVDTLSRALAGGDESSSADMGALVKNMDRLREHTGAHVAFVHHSGKDASKGARGWSGLRAAIDTEIEIVPGEIRVTKQRDMEAIRPLGFSLESVPVGTDADGDTITSCVVLPASLKAQTDFTEKTASLTKAQSAALKVVTELTEDKRSDLMLSPFEPDPDVAIVDFRAGCFGLLSNGSRNTENRQFLKVSVRLSELGLIEINEETVRLTR
jgi:hypothetical protein